MEPKNHLWISLKNHILPNWWWYYRPLIYYMIGVAFSYNKNVLKDLIYNSKILFLDEPTTGLDVVLSKNILEYIKNNNKEHAVFISSHDLDLIEKYCNKIIYINDGECLYFGEMSTFLKEYNKEIVYNISYSGEISKDVVEKHKDTITIVDDKNLKIFLEKEEEISNVLKLLLAENITIGSLQKEEITLKRILELEE